MDNLRCILLNILLIVSLLVNHSSGEDSNQNKTLGSYCNPLKDSPCQHNKLVCFRNQCECAPGYKAVNSTDPNKVCQESYCKEDGDCQTQWDPFRKCNKGKCECLPNMTLNKKYQRCAPFLGQKCIPDNEDVQIANMVCRNGIYVCRPDHYPNEEWTFCKQTPSECSSDEECQMFSDFFRVCHYSKRLGRAHCQCDPTSRENPQTLQCVYFGPMISNFLLMPFFLLPMCLMIIIVAYVGHRLFKSNSSRNINRNHETTSVEPSTSSRNNRHRRNRINNRNRNEDFDSNKTPSALNQLNTNDAPPSYELVLQERIEEQIARIRQQQQNIPGPSSSINIPSSSISTISFPDTGLGTTTTITTNTNSVIRTVPKTTDQVSCG